MYDETTRQYCNDQIRKVRQRYKRVERRVNEPVITESTSNLISDAQQSIELAVKTMFHVVNEEPPNEHEVTFENAYPLLNAELVVETNERRAVARCVFLTQFWNQFYVLAKYGHESEHVSPDELFSEHDVQAALWHTKFCYQTVRRIHDLRKQERHKSQ